MQWTLHTALSIASAMVCLGVAGLLWERQNRAGAVSLLGFTLATALWAAGNALQAGSTTLAWKVVSLHVQYVAIATVPVTWFAFAAEYTGQRRWLRPRFLVAIAAPLVLLLLLEWTNGVHGLVRTYTGLVTVDGVVHVERTFGPAFWVGVVYSNLVLGTGTLLLLRGLVRTRRVYRMQVALVIGGSLVPWFANVAYLTGDTVIEPEVYYAVTAIAFAIAVSRYRLFDLTPVARSTVLDELPDPVFVLDATDHIVDVNAAAAALTGRTERELLGEHGEGVLPEHDVLDDPPAQLELELGPDDTRYYAPQVSSLGDRGDAGRVVVLRNVTNLAESRRDLERRNAQLEHVADVMSHDLRSPLNVAKGRLELVSEASEGAVSSDLQTVADAHDRMDAIIESTLRAARATLGDSETEAVRLADVCRRAWATAETGGMSRRFECGDATLEADPELLATLLENLFRNSATHGQANEVRVEVTEDGFVVEDDGDGFDADVQVDRVMERGYTTSDDGTGLGLAIVSDVAESHGWTVDVGESETGGARFAFSGVELSRRPTGSAPRSPRDT